MKIVVGATKILACVSLFGCAVTAVAQSASEGLIIPHRIRDTAGAAPTRGSKAERLPPITYHGGAMMQTPTVYIIWYGNWADPNGSDTPAGQQIIRDFIYGLSGSPYYQTNASFSTVNGTPTGSITHDPIAGEYTDTGSQGNSLSDAKVQAVVNGAITGGHLPIDTAGIYIVLSASEITETSGFCSVYCGWHTWGTISGQNIKYSFIGNANRCLSACAAQTISPNGNAGIDGTVSVLAHEIEETNTDPDITAWFDARGAEDGDKCAWTFGSAQKKTSKGAYYNMTLPTSKGGTRKFLVQRELDASSFCYVDYVTKQQ